MKKILGLLVVISLLTVSCSEEIDASFLNASDEIALECYISPSDTIVKAVLSRATSFTETEIPFEDLFIKDAQITIGNDKVQKNLLYNSSKHYYELKVTDDFKIEKGVTYSIKATTSEGKVVSASCIVPTRSYSPSDIEIEKSYRGTDLVDIRLKWLKNDAKFFVIRPYYYYSNTNVKDKPVLQKLQFFTNTDFVENQAISKYITNDLTVGGNKNTVFFYVADENFFNYSKTKELNVDGQTDILTQPISPKYNVNGGLGCFGAYTITRIDYEF